MAALCDLIEYMYEPVEALDPKPQLCDSCRMINFQRVLSPPPWKERGRWGTWHVDDLEQREISLSSPCVLCQVLLAVYCGSPSATWQLRAMIDSRIDYNHFRGGSYCDTVILFTCARNKFSFSGRHIQDIERILLSKMSPWTRGTHTKWDIQELQPIFSSWEEKISRATDPKSERERSPLTMLNTPVPEKEEITHRGVLVRKDVPALRLIDCADDGLKVLDADGSMEWVALSYVWSLTKASNTAAFNGELRSADDGPSSNSPDHCKASSLISSRLIQGAAAVVKSLGYRYLWVDQLCIKQDSSEERHFQIRQMASIYSQAKLTIVSMSDTGYLPGVKEARKPTEVTITLRDNESGKQLFILKPTPSIIADFNGSLWSTRGWTFQEALLSSKVLYFTDSRVLLDYRPGNSMYSLFTSHEVCISELRRPSDEYIKSLEVVNTLLQPWKPWRRCKYPKEEFWRFHAALLDLIEAYTAKQLSYPEDALDAIRGILRLFGEPQYILFSLQGLPCLLNRSGDGRHNPDGEDLLGYSLCLGLMWFSTNWKTSKPRGSFPSWSWAGWMGEVKWMRNLHLLPHADAATVRAYAKLVAVHGSCGSIRALDDDALRHFWDCSDSGKEAKGLLIRAWLISNLISRILAKERPMSESEDPWTIKNLYCHIDDTSTTEECLREGILSGVYGIVLMMEKRYRGPRSEAYALVVQWDHEQNTSEEGIRIAQRVGLVFLEAKWERDEEVLLLSDWPGLSEHVDMLLM